MASLLMSIYAYYYMTRNLSKIIYMIKIQKSKFANIQFREFDQSEPGHFVKFCVCFHPVGYHKYFLTLLHNMWGNVGWCIKLC